MTVESNPNEFFPGRGFVWPPAGLLSFRREVGVASPMFWPASLSSSPGRSISRLDRAICSCR